MLPVCLFSPKSEDTDANDEWPDVESGRFIALGDRIQQQIALGSKIQQQALLAELGFQLGELVSLRFDGSIGSIEGVEVYDGMTTLLVGMPVGDKEGTTQVRFPLAEIEKIIDLEELDANIV